MYVRRFFINFHTNVYATYCISYYLILLHFSSILSTECQMFVVCVMVHIWIGGQVDNQVASVVL